MDDVIEIMDDLEMTDKPTKNVYQYSARRIVFCIDMSDEMNEILRASGNGGVKDTNLYSSSRLETVKRFLKRYVATNKLIGNDKDEYAIVLLTDVAVWSVDFTINASVFNTEIDGLSEDRLRTYVGFDMQSLGDTLNAKLRLQNVDYYYQAIVIYGRSSLPTLPENDVFTNMRKRNNFMLDVLFLHDGFKDTTAQAIYDCWSELDKPTRPGWFYECSLFTGKDKIAEALSQLIGHPAYRAEQPEPNNHAI
ncbi:Ribonucleotide-diphosphate reductase (RNR), small subunit [Mucor velutinosus]|uniref:BRISC and BRCA1-A complex member 1 n=1 Tax=Mucor velutinosus TaxID=708070 RepID=A0AAN7HST7_9FUNG|nr:Ribonucleotide-diphosphate reductase (RNR), small subunit [Mucor velutinosus]